MPRRSGAEANVRDARLRPVEARGFDVTGTVADEVTAGLSGEASRGVGGRGGARGVVLTYQGRPIEAFFYSTCGGRTADGTEVFRGAAEPYLRSIADEAPNVRCIAASLGPSSSTGGRLERRSFLRETLEPLACNRRIPVKFVRW